MRGGSAGATPAHTVHGAVPADAQGDHQHQPIEDDVPGREPHGQPEGERVHPGQGPASGADDAVPWDKSNSQPPRFS